MVEKDGLNLTSDREEVSAELEQNEILGNRSQQFSFRCGNMVGSWKSKLDHCQVEMA